jgi:hypothetical protein
MQKTDFVGNQVRKEYEMRMLRIAARENIR